MDKKFPSIKDRLAQWRELADAAEQAQARLKQAGQAAASPEYMELAMRARLLRNQADREFSTITRTISREEPGEFPARRPDGGSANDPKSR